MNSRENEMDKSNKQNIQTGKYSDEGRDGDYNTQNTQGPGKAGADELYEDEKEYVSDSSTTEKKSEEDSYVSYDGNNDQTPPSRD